MDEKEQKKDNQVVWEELGISNDFIFRILHQLPEYKIK